MPSSEAGMDSYWDRTWSRYGSLEGSLDVWSIIDFHKTERLLTLPETIGNAVEVGCGSGRLAATLASAGWDVWCLDRSVPALALAKQRFDQAGLTATFVKGDAFDLPLPSSSMDLVTSTGLLEHFADPSPIVAEMTRVLRPSGLFYSDIVPAKFSLLRAFDRMRRKVTDEFFERPFNKQEIVDLLEGAGLVEVTVIACGIYPPRIPILDRSKQFRYIHHWLSALVAPLSASLDGTWLADLLGVYYFAFGYKRAPT